MQQMRIAAIRSFVNAGPQYEWSTAQIAIYCLCTDLYAFAVRPIDEETRAQETATSMDLTAMSLEDMGYVGVAKVITLLKEKLVRERLIWEGPLSIAFLFQMRFLNDVSEEELMKFENTIRLPGAAQKWVNNLLKKQ